MSDRLIGTTLGDYRVLELLGQGSLARVYRALQVSLNRRVALKVFQEGLLTPGDMVERFHREAVYLAQFEHPNILPIYGSGQAGSFHFFALRLVEEGSLADMLLRKPPVRTVYGVLRNVAAGVAALHAKGGIHRDLKPTNVLVERGVGILADFGLARMLEDTTITQSGAIVGTPAYLSPEQWNREKATQASDVFSFGVLLYESLTGRHPFLPSVAGAPPRGSGDLRAALRTNMAKGSPPPMGMVTVPEGLDPIVLRCLREDPVGRFPEMHQVERALDEVRWPDPPKRVTTMRPRDHLLEAISPSRPEDRTDEPAPPPPRPEGTPFGPYFLREELGQGGTGVVYRAWDPRLAREVALKVLKAGEMAGADDVQRFTREARSEAGLRHPGIIGVHDVGIEGGRHYFTMDLVEGKSLRDMLEKDVPPLETALRLLGQVARAVEHAHRHGIIHCDLKPANILVEGNERAVVGDFGVARSVTGEGGATATRAVTGTPAYMAPEQARGGPADARTDVYALGAILYQMLTRKAPFEGESAAVVLEQVLHDEPLWPRRVNPMVPRDLEVICHMAMRKHAARRYASAAEFADDLERYLRREPIRARPPGRWYRLAKRVARHRVRYLVGGIAALTLLVILTVWLARHIRFTAEVRNSHQKLGFRMDPR